MNDSTERNADMIGVALSILCAAHCVVTSFFIMSLPILARYYISNPYIHISLAILIIPIGLIAFVKGFRHHRRALVLTLGISGVLIVGLTPQLTHFFKLNLNEPWLLIVGSLILVLAHLLNLYLKSNLSTGRV